MRIKAIIPLFLMIVLISHVISNAEANLSLDESEYDTSLVTRIVSLDLPPQSSEIGFNDFQLNIRSIDRQNQNYMCDKIQIGFKYYSCEFNI